MFDAILLPIIAFAATAIADVVWVEWSKNVQLCRPHRAAFFGVGIILCGSVVTLTIIKGNGFAYIASLLGAYAGTWLILAHHRTEEKHGEKTKAG